MPRLLAPPSRQVRPHPITLFFPSVDRRTRPGPQQGTTATGPIACVSVVCATGDSPSPSDSPPRRRPITVSEAVAEAVTRVRVAEPLTGSFITSTCG